MASSRFKTIFTPGLFDGDVAIVTGGASGIGKAIAKELAVLDCTVIIASRKYDKLENCAKEINHELGKDLIYPVKCNIRIESDVKNLMVETVLKFGKINHLVNNGGGQFTSLFSDLKTKGWNAVIDTNLNGTYYCLREVYHAWMDEHGGNIVNIVMNNANGFPLMSHSAAARAGIQNLTKTLALEWADKGIRINSVSPGVIYSETAVANYEAGREVFKAVEKVIPLKRTGTVEEISGLVCFLLSPAASFITGDIVRADGGQKLYSNNLFTIEDHATIKPYRWQNIPSKL